MTPSPSLLEMRGISKSFSGIHILRHVSFDVRRGEVHALLGENGAGKSTLMRILAGVFPSDAGEIWWRGQVSQFRTPREAQEAGIAIIHQETSLVGHLSVAENIFLGYEPPQLPGLPFINWERMYEQSRQLLKRLNLSLDPQAPVNTLKLAEQQMVEVCKALRQSADLLIMDEPTASLSPPEVETLWATIRNLTEQGVAVIFISHRLEEVMHIAHRATVLRDGIKVGTVSMSEAKIDDLVRLMVGRNLSDKVPRRRTAPGPDVLQVHGLTLYGVLDNIDFNLQAGEILGLTGLMGSGCTTLVRAIFGLEHVDAGEIYLAGQRVTIDSPQTAIGLGIGLVTEDREAEGVIPDMSTHENITLTALQHDWPGPFIHHEAEQALAEDYIRRLNIYPPALDHPARFLSGGMQQKVILSRWLAAQSRVLIFDQPTRGIDIASKMQIYRFIVDLADRGVAILLVSPDLPEILRLSDRILVMHQGRVAGRLRRDEATFENVLAYATGGPAPWARKE